MKLHVYFIFQQQNPSDYENVMELPMYLQKMNHCHVLTRILMHSL